MLLMQYIINLFRHTVGAHFLFLNPWSVFVILWIDENQINLRKKTDSKKWNKTVHINFTTNFFIKRKKKKQFGYWNLHSYNNIVPNYAIQVLIAPFTALRAYGIYDIEYQVMANDWIIMHINASKLFFSCENR